MTDEATDSANPAARVRTRRRRLLLFTTAAVSAVLLVGYAWSRSLTAEAEQRYPASGELVEVGDRTWHVIDAGAGPPVVLLHGAFGGADDFRGPVLEALSSRYRVIVPDRPGSGWTTRGTTADGGDPDTPAEQAAALRELLDELDVQDPVVLGFSWGGSVAAAWATLHADELAAVVTVNAATHPWPGWTSPIYTTPGVPVLGPLLTHTVVGPLAQFRTADGAAKAFDPQPVPDAFDRSPVALSLTPSRYLSVAADMAALKASVVELSPRYGEIDCPLVVVVGEGDLIAGPRVHSYPLAEAVQGAELVSVADGGHQLGYTHSQVLIDAVDRAYELAEAAGRFSGRNERTSR